MAGEEKSALADALIARDMTPEEEWASVQRGEPVAERAVMPQIAREPTSREEYGVDPIVHEGTRARQSFEITHPNQGHDTGFYGAGGARAVGGIVGRGAVVPQRQQTLAEAIDEAAPLDEPRQFVNEQRVPDTLDNAPDPWAWMERMGYVKPEGVDLKSRAAAARKDVERAQLGLAKDWINSPEGAREMQARLAGEKTPTHVWDKAPDGATVQQRYAHRGNFFNDADQLRASPTAKQLYDQQYASMTHYGIPTRPSGGYSPMAQAEFEARVRAGQSPEEILYQENRARKKAELDLRREKAFKADFKQHRTIARPIWTWFTSDDEAAQKAWEDDLARRGLGP